LFGEKLKAVKQHKKTKVRLIVISKFLLKMEKTYFNLISINLPCY
jgi:hypothetical protein